MGWLVVACGEGPHPGTPPSLDWWWRMGEWYMCLHVECNVASFAPGFSKHCVRTIIVLIAEQLSDSC